jgi:hypothetical protein
LIFYGVSLFWPAAICLDFVHYFRLCSPLSSGIEIRLYLGSLFPCAFLGLLLFVVPLSKEFFLLGIIVIRVLLFVITGLAVARFLLLWRDFDSLDLLTVLGISDFVAFTLILFLDIFVGFVAFV